MTMYDLDHEEQDESIRTYREHLDDCRAEVARLREYAEADCRCPCCDETRQCTAGCTYRDDSIDGHARMVRARRAVG